jgi:UDP-2,3-diacylglucosamine pyrophosphatase LpxH
VKTLIVGDTHGNAIWLRDYIFPLAMTLKADAIVQLGDFGAWEHTLAGQVFMDRVGELGEQAGVPLYWLHGNHDKHSHTLKAYKPDQRGFLTCREFVYYIPQGFSWLWGGVSLRSFGGAYSVDRRWRVEHEARTGMPATLWFPEEEMTDSEMDKLLAVDATRKQIILSHDKPYSAKPNWRRKDIPGCMPNQLRLERALRAHKPDWWFHGHLHYHYTDQVHGEDFETRIVGLDPDDEASEPGWTQTGTWAVADLDDGQVTVKLGSKVYVDSDIMQEAMSALH